MLLDKYSEGFDSEPFEELIADKVFKKIEEDIDELSDDETTQNKSIKNKDEETKNIYQDNLEYSISMLLDLLTDILDLIQMSSVKHHSNLNMPLLNLSKKALQYRSEISKHANIVKGSDKLKFINMKRRLDTLLKTQVIPNLAGTDANFKNRLLNLTK